MNKGIQSVKGMRDILPEDMLQWHFLEATVRDLLASYGYQEIRIPILEHTSLFKRGVGEVTDIVEKEMYTFMDQSQLSLSLRPEGTAGCVRAGIEQGLLYNQQQRLWYQGPMFRYERPQKGRYRQFHQIGVETFGFAGADIDVELIAMTARLWKALGLQPLRLEINSLGSNESRLAYRSLLVDYFSQHLAALDEDSKRRLHTNPLRILDTKNPAMKDIVAAAPNIHEHLDLDSVQHFAQLQHLLQVLDIPFTINPCLVRGLDYYNRTVFEWVSDDLGAQGTVCAGGRYDGLVEQLGGKAMPACGFAMGVERLVELIKNQNPHLRAKSLDLYVMTSDSTLSAGMALVEQLRTNLPQFSIQLHCGGGSFKSQIQKADKSGAQFALILGDDEWSQQKITLKSLRTTGEQERLALDTLSTILAARLNEGKRAIT